MLKLRLFSVFVDDQEKAVKFYTEVLGFEMVTNVPVGEFNWVTVGSKQVELLLEPNDNQIAKDYQEGLKKQGIPALMLFTDDLDQEFARLKDKVEFVMEPTKTKFGYMAIFDDTCGNLVQIFEEKDD